MQESKLKNFSDFADYATRELHDGLLRGGSAGMRTALYKILPGYALWQKQQRAEQEAIKAKEKHEKS